MTSTTDRYRANANRLVRNPDDPEALVDQFAVISENKGNAAHYLPLAKRAYLNAPDQISPVFNYASALHRVGDFEGALKQYLAAVKIAPIDWMAKCLHHVGIAHRALGQNKQAIDYYEQAYAINGRPACLKDKALAMLADGLLKDGLEAFEIRREVSIQKMIENGGNMVAQQKLPPGVVHWEGQDLTGKTVVVYHEEGSGDFIQFCRFIPKLRERGVAKILLCGPVPNLLDLVADNIAFDGIVPLSGPFDCDYVVGSMSLPWRCGVDLPDVTGRAYFKAEPAKIPRRAKLNVGLVWRGNPAYANDTHRSLAFSEYSQLFDLPGTAFYSLQAGPAGLEVGQLGLDGFVANLEPMAQTWRDTARLISALDVVVTVDTACAHLAGALGKPVFILITNASDWRWNRNSQKSVWYDSARVIRQKKQGKWGPCIAEVRRQLEGMLSERRKAA